MELRSAKANHVRRNLFGPVDHDQLQQDFQCILYSSMEKAQKRWNFDFMQELPTEGLLQWEELQCHKVPAFYHPYVAGETRKPLQPVNHVSARQVKVHHTGKVKLMGKSKPAKKTAGKKSQGGKRKKTACSDGYTARKQIRMDMQTPVKKSVC